MATIKDVAQRVGVSVSTVSHALSGKRPVSDETRMRIFQAIEELGYQPSVQAQSLVTGRTQIIGMLFPYEAEDTESAGLNTIQLEMIWEANQSVQADGYSLQLYTEVNDESTLRSICQNCDGLLVSMVRLHDERISYLIRQQKPFVMLGHPEEAGEVSWVDTDFDSMVVQQVSHLVELGHRDIAFVDKPESLIARELGYTVRSRQAYFHACQQFGLEPYVLACGVSIEDGRRAMIDFLDQHPNLTALAAFNDLAAVGAYYALLERGLHIPDDFSIINFTSPGVLRATTPFMTAMTNTGPLVSKTAASILIAQLMELKNECQQVLIQSELIPGMTTGPVPSGIRAAK
jgi:DNA-binding LacI/PurR family transcriptional regulator